MDMERRIYESTLYIHDMREEQISVADIAANARLSPSYFSFMFRNITGYTVKNYLSRYRLYRAALEVRDGNERLVEIAYANGFSSQQAFTRSFSQMYGIAPAQFRLLRPAIDPFPPENLWSRREMSMELANCFESVRFMNKGAFYAAGVECDIHYNSADGTDPIGGLWKAWGGEGIAKLIPDQVSPGTVYGMTCNETANNTGKYFIGVEVSSLASLPIGLVGRRFEASEYAVFDTTLAIIWTGDFWRTFYRKWLPESGYIQPDEPLRKAYATFNKYPAIEVYGDGFKDEQSIMQIYAPVVKR